MIDTKGIRDALFQPFKEQIKDFPSSALQQLHPAKIRVARIRLAATSGSIFNHKSKEPCDCCGLTSGRHVFYCPRLRA